MSAWRIEKDAEGRFHFSEREYYATRELFGIVSTFNKCAGQLEKRVREIPGGWRDLKLIMALSEKLMRNILSTVPKKKLAVIKRELDSTEVIVNVKNTIAPPAEGDTDGYTYVSSRALERITQRCVAFECFACSKKGAEVRKCQLRKDIEDTYMYDYPKVGKNECPFMGQLGGIDDD